MKRLLFLLTGIVCLNPAFAQDMDGVEIRTTKVTDSIYMLEGSGGNIAVSVGEDGVFLVDDQFAPLTDKIFAAIAEISDRPVRFVINTHFHYDHTDGNERMGEAGAMIVSHDNSRIRMSGDQVIALFKREQDAYDEVGLPVITFSESMTFHFNGEEINVFHPGSAHTDGDAIVHFKTSDVLHMGDVFVRYGFPFIDQPNGGHVDGLIRGVQRALDRTGDATRVIPGHGQLSGRSDMIAFVDMLTKIRDRVMAGINAGHSLEAIVASDPTRGFEERGIETGPFVKTVYDSLTHGHGH